MTEHIFQALYSFGENGDEPVRLLDQSGIPWTRNETGRRLLREDILRLAANATGIIAGVEPYTAGVLDALPHLKCLSRAGVGVDNIDLAHAAARGIVVRNTPQVVVQPVVELTLAMIFDLLRRLTLHTLRLRRREWRKTSGNLLAGKTVGILGLGGIGRAVAEVLPALGVRVIGSDIAPDMDWAARAGVEVVDTGRLLQHSDILSLHISLLAEHPFVLDAAAIARMKDGAFVVNVSRGNVVDDQALAEALQTGKLAGAALDVFPQEPYTGPLCDVETAVLTPHVATLTRESRVQMEAEAVRNLLETLGHPAPDAES